MNTPSKTLPLFGKGALRETTVMLAMAWLLPFLVHLLPWGGPRPLGVYLLPLFWMTFVAVYFRGAPIGLLVGLAATLLNSLGTALPAVGTLASTGLEIACFVGAAAVLLSKFPRFALGAPLSYLIGKAAAIGVELLVLDHAENPFDHWTRSARNGLAGLAVLALINLALVRFYPRRGSLK